VLPNIPAELLALPRWVARGVDKKPYTAPGRLASSTDPSTWLTFDQARALAASEGLAGVGFVFNGDGITGVDLDHCRNAETGEVQPWALRLVERLASYTEISPSGEGLHIFVRASLTGPGRKKKGAEGGAIEVYDRARYFTVTGQHVPGTPTAIESRQDVVADVYARLGGSDAPAQKSALGALTTEDHALTVAIESSKDGPAFFRLFHSGETRPNRTSSENDAELATVLCRYTADDAQVERLMRASPLYRDKWDRKGDDLLARAIKFGRRQTGTVGGFEAPRDILRSLADFLRDPDAMRPPTPVIPRLAWAGRITLFASSEGWGKSTLARAGAAAITTGQAFLDGQPHPPSNVLWARLEEAEYDCMSGASRFGADPSRFLTWTPGTAPVPELLARMQELRPALTVIDSIQEFAILAGVEKLDDAGQMGRALMGLARSGRELNTAMLWLGQGAKATGRYRNSSWLGHQVDAVLELKEPAADSPVREILVRKRRMDVFGFRVELVHGHYRMLTGRRAPPNVCDAADKILSYLVEIGERVNVGTIKAAVSLRANIIAPALDLLKSEGKADALPGPHKGQLWCASIIRTASTAEVPQHELQGEDSDLPF
jgi:AAA domain-containing protein/primase/DNA polymerase family protein